MVVGLPGVVRCPTPVAIPGTNLAAVLVAIPVLRCGAKLGVRLDSILAAIPVAKLVAGPLEAAPDLLGANPGEVPASQS